MGADRVDNRFGNRGDRGLVDDVIDAGENCGKIGRLAYVRGDDFSAAERLQIYVVPSREVIDNLYRLLATQQFFGDVRTNETSAPGNDVISHPCKTPSLLPKSCILFAVTR